MGGNRGVEEDKALSVSSPVCAGMYFLPDFQSGHWKQS